LVLVFAPFSAASVHAVAGEALDFDLGAKADAVKNWPR